MSTCRRKGQRRWHDVGVTGNTEETNDGRGKLRDVRSMLEVMHVKKKIL
jgi:hypothetical protein